MHSLLKNLLLLLGLFIIGALMLGLVNPGIHVDHEVEVYATPSMAWDIYKDTASWNHWKMKDGEITWLKGRTMEQGSQWSISQADQTTLKEEIDEWHLDSFMVVKGEKGLLTSERRTKFVLGEGKTKIIEEVKWSTQGFTENIKLNFERSDLQKQLEVRLDSLKKWVDSGRKE